MLKVKKGKYLYAQIKIDGKVKDFYICKVSDVDDRKHADKLDNLLKEYCSDRDLTHEFQERRTVYGKFWSDLNKIEGSFAGAALKGRV